MNDNEAFEKIKSILDDMGFSAEISEELVGKSLDLKFHLDENNDLPFSPIHFSRPKDLVGNLIQFSKAFQNKEFLEKYSENLVDEFTDKASAKSISEIVGYWFGKCISPLDNLYGAL